MRRHKRQPTKPRQFTISSESTKEFENNAIRTSKYTPWNFLPKAIIIQFRRLANIYFLVTAVLQSISTISSLSAGSAIAPFIVVIVLSVIREGVEDIPRQQNDKKVNNLTTPILKKDGQLHTEKWKEVKVGDILLVKDGEDFPADMVLLKSANDNGMAFIETASLDGEKNLKPKFCLSEIAAYFNDQKVKNQALYKCAIYAQPPDPSIYKFEGAFINETGDKSTLSAKQLLLRGARLKNTEWALGAVVYTGHDTKVMRNSEVSKTKQSRVEHVMNRYIGGIFCVQMIFCAIAAIGNRIWNGANLDGYPDLARAAESKNLEAFLNFLSYFLLTNTMIPISLIVTIEIVKFIQARFMQADNDMYSASKEKAAKSFVPLSMKNWDLLTTSLVIKPVLLPATKWCSRISLLVVKSMVPKLNPSSSLIVDILKPVNNSRKTTKKMMKILLILRKSSLIKNFLLSWLLNQVNL